MSQPRKWMSEKKRHSFLRDNDYRCFYCGHLIGCVAYDGHKYLVLDYNLDHFVPFSYSGSDVELIPSCSICNRIKSDKHFMDIEECRSFITLEWDIRAIQIVFEPTVSNEHDPYAWSMEYIKWLGITPCAAPERLSKRRASRGSVSLGPGPENVAPEPSEDQREHVSREVQGARSDGIFISTYQHLRSEDNKGSRKKVVAKELTLIDGQFMIG